MRRRLAGRISGCWRCVAPERAVAADRRPLGAVGPASRRRFVRGGGLGQDGFMLVGERLCRASGVMVMLRNAHRPARPFARSRDDANS